MIAVVLSVVTITKSSCLLCNTFFTFGDNRKPVYLFAHK